MEIISLWPPCQDCKSRLYSTTVIPDFSKMGVQASCRWPLFKENCLIHMLPYIINVNNCSFEQIPWHMLDVHFSNPGQEPAVTACFCFSTFLRCRVATLPFRNCSTFEKSGLADQSWNFPETARTFLKAILQ